MLNDTNNLVGKTHGFSRDAIHFLAGQGRCSMLWSAMLSLLVCGICLSVSSAYADESVEKSSTELQEVVVTAQKRSESLQNVPIAITAVTADDLEKSGITSTADLAASIPGLIMENGLTGQFPHLRGVGTTAISAGEENSIATYIDGVYMGSIMGGLMDLNNIEQIEVDKGPQGTLYGRNATGGVINIRTKDPKQTFGGILSGTYGNYDTASTNDYITGGIASNLAADLAFHYSNQADGFGRNFANGIEVSKGSDLAARSKWLWTPGDEDRLTMSLDFERNNNNGLTAYHPQYGNPTNWGPGAPAPTGQPFLYTGGNWDTDTYYNGFHSTRQGGASLNYQHEFGFAQLSNISAWREANTELAFPSNPTPNPTAFASWHQIDRQVSDELQLASNGSSAVKWVGGLFLLNGAASYNPFTITGPAAAPAPLQSINFHANETTRSAALYGQATMPLPVIPETDLTIGLRYTTERRGLTGDTVVLFLPATAIPSKASGVTDASQTFDKLTWRFALDHHFTDNLLGYVSYNRGFKSGVYNTIPPGGPGATPVQPEVLDAYEIGLKTDLLGKRLRINTAAFYYDYSQLQVTVFTPVSALLENGAKAKIYGLDLDVEALVSEGLTLTAGVEAVHDYFASFPAAEFFVPQTVAQGGGNAVEHGSAEGNKLPFTPNLTFNLSANYTVPFTYGHLDFNLTYAYTDGLFSGPDNNLAAPVSHLVNARGGWTLKDDRTQVILWAKNLRNQAVPRELKAAGNPGGYNEIIDAPPRTYGITLEYRF